MVDPPPLPPRFNHVTTVIAVGTGLWVVAAVVLAIVVPLDVWFWTCVTGAVLGALGYGVFAWQRAAVRRGARGAQHGLE